MSIDHQTVKPPGKRPTWFSALLLLDAFALGGLAVWILVLTSLEYVMTGFITPSGEIFHALDMLFPYWLGHTVVSLLLVLITAGAYLWLKTRSRIGIALTFITPIILVGYFYMRNQVLTTHVSADPIQATPTSSDPAYATFSVKPNGVVGWNTYRSARFGFVLDYPADWVLLLLPNATYQSVTDQVWLSPRSSAFPPPGTDARPPLVIEITPQDPAAKWKAEYFNAYEAKAYKLGQVEGVRISGVNKEGLNDEVVILARLDDWYLSLYPSQHEDSVTQATIDGILATFRKD